MEVLNVTDRIYTYIEDVSKTFSKTNERVLLTYTAASMRLQSQHTCVCVASQEQWCNLFNLPVAQAPYVYMVRITIFGRVVDKLSNTKAYCLA